MSNDFDVRIFRGHRRLRVTGAATPYRPATGPSMANAGGDPPEGGELEDVEVFLLHRRKAGGYAQRLLCDAVAEGLDLDDEIREALAEEPDDERI